MYYKVETYFVLDFMFYVYLPLELHQVSSSDLIESTLT